MNHTRNEFAASEKLSLLELLGVLARRKKMIIGLTVVAALISVGSAMRMPNLYTSSTTILPPQQNQSSAGMMLNQLGTFSGMMGGALALKNQNTVYMAMLQSRTVMERIATRFDLQKAYGLESMTATLSLIDARTKVATNKEGLIVVEVDDKNPQLAANMANAFVDELNVLMHEFSLADASHKRLFFEQQMKQAKDQLTDAEMVLDRTPNTSLKYMDAVRNLKYQESVYEILSKQFEIAKLDEAKDYPLIQVLDKATPPERKSKPKRSQIVIQATLLTFFFAVILAFVIESILRVKQQPEQAERLQKLRDALWKK